MPKVQHSEEQLQELTAFGWFPAGRPILARQWDGADACQKCNGFGTYGNPLCGAVYTCTACGGSGQRSDWRGILRIAWRLSPLRRLWLRLRSWI